MYDNRAIAKKLRKEGKYLEAVPLYEPMWETSVKEECDCWLGWEYADTLKKVGLIDKAIEICKKVYLCDNTFEPNNKLLAWSLYEKYINVADINNSSADLDKIMKITKFITSIVNQSQKGPYELAIWKVIKLCKNSSKYKAEKLNYLIDKLDVNLLSDIPYSYPDNSGKIREMASRKEEWFSIKCKTLMDMKKYEECLEMCDRALTSINKFHYDNDIWIKVKKAFCIGIQGNPIEAIKLLKSVLPYKDHWSIHDMIFNFELSLGNYDNALLYAYNAALTKDPPNMKIKLYYTIGKTLESMKNYEYSARHYLFSQKVRLENGWKVPDELESSIERVSKIFQNQEDEDLYKTLRTFWINEKSKLMPQFEGTITNILKNGKAGFIRTNDNSYYFKISSFMGKRRDCIINKKVIFSLKDSFDKSRGVATKEAVNITLKVNGED